MFKNMKLGFKLTIGFGFVLVFTGIVALVGMRGFDDIRDRVSKAKAVDDIVKELFEAMDNEKDFIITGEFFYSENVRMQINNIYEQLKTTNKLFHQKINCDQTDKTREKIKTVLRKIRL